MAANSKDIEAYIYTKNSEVKVLEDFVEVSIKKKAIIETADVVEVAQIIQRDASGVNSVLVQFSGSFSADKKTCEYYCSERLGCATDFHALVLPQLSDRLLALVSLSYLNPKFSFKVFSNKEEAVSWLEHKSSSSNLDKDLLSGI